MTDTAGGIVGAILDRFSEKRAPTENEYLGENGLLYCSKCHTPVQCRVNMFGTPKIVSCVCKCRREEEEKRKAQERELEHQRRISQLRANGIQESIFWTGALKWLRIIETFRWQDAMWIIGVRSGRKTLAF